MPAWHCGVRANRPENLSSLQIGRHVVLERDRRAYPGTPRGNEVSKANSIEIPNCSFDTWETHILGWFVRSFSATSSMLRSGWSQWGGALSYVGIGKSFARSLSTGSRPMDFPARWPRRRGAGPPGPSPGPIRSACLETCFITGGFSTTQFYNRTRGIEASRAYRHVISEFSQEANVNCCLLISGLQGSSSVRPPHQKNRQYFE